MIMRTEKLLVLFFLIAASIFGQSKSEKIDELVQRYHDYKLFNGAVLVADSANIVITKGYGYADLEWDIPVDAGTKFRLGSVTKQFTSMVIMQLVQEGKLKVTDKLSDVLPYYRKDTGSKITIENLLVHTSGIPSYTSSAKYFTEDALKHWQVKDFIMELCMGDLEFEPGSMWVYNNSGYAILGAIIEQIEKKSYAEAVKDRIFIPLGMNDSGYDTNQEVIKKRARGYFHSFNGDANSMYVDMSTPYSAGALYSTVTDLYKWDRALYSNNLLSDELMNKYFTPVTSNYAYGWVVTPLKLSDNLEINTTSHGGGINGFSSYILRDVDDKNLVVLLSNYEGTELVSISNDILKILYDLPTRQPKRPISQFLFEYAAKNEGSNLLEVYNSLMEEEGEAFSISEPAMNTLGYNFLHNGKTRDAMSIFTINATKFPNSSNVYDSRGEAYLALGDTANAIEDYKKSVELNPENQNGRSVLQSLGIKTENEIKIDKEILKMYSGEYEVTPQFKIKIRVAEDKIYAQATGQPEFEMFPVNNMKFFLKIVNAQIEFDVDENEVVQGLTIYQNGATIKAKMIK